MDRRAFLTTLAAGVAGTAGCAALPGQGREPGSTVTPVDPDQTPADGDGTTETPDGSGGFERPDDRASIVDFETRSRTVALRPTGYTSDDRTEVALWFARPATSDHPALIRGWIRNANNFVNTVRVEWLPLVGRHRGRPSGDRTDSPSLVAVPTADNDLSSRPGAVERDSNGDWWATDSGSVPDTYRLDVGEGVRVSYLLAGVEPDTGQPTGGYEFRGRDAAVTLEVWETNSPGPDEDSRFAGRSVPPLDDGVGWYHEADGATQAFVRPDAERTTLDAAVTFEAVNHSHESLTCGHWNLYKLVDGEWFHVGPFLHTADCRALAPGERKRWTLRAFDGAPVECEGNCDCDGFARGYLGGGRYGVVAGYGRSTDDSGALVELRGDPVSVTSTAGADRQQDGGTVTVTTPRYGDGESQPDATLVLTRATEADERLIPEQVMGSAGGVRGSRQRSALRNALAAVGPGVERVVVRADQDAVDGALGHDADQRRVAFRGQAYRLRRGQSEQ